MPDIKISELPVAVAGDLSADAVLPVTVAGATRKASLAAIRAALTALGIGGLGPVRVISAATTLTKADIGGWVLVDSAAAVDINLNSADADIPAGATFRVAQLALGQAKLVTLVGGDAVLSAMGRETGGPGDVAVITRLASTPHWRVTYELVGWRRPAQTLTAPAPRALSRGDAGQVLRVDSATLYAFELLNNIDGAYPLGMEVEVRQVGVGAVEIDPDPLMTLNVPDGFRPRTARRGGWLRLHQVGPGLWDVVGDLAPL